MARGPAQVGVHPDRIRPELLSREDGAELARALLEWTEWPQVRLVSVLKEVAKECELPVPGLDTVTVSRWVTGRQCPTAFYARLLLALLARLLLAAGDDGLASRLDRLPRRDFLLRAAAAAGVTALAPRLAGSASSGLAGVLDDSGAVHASQIEAAVGYLRRVFNEFDTADWLLGPQLQLPTVASHFELVEKLMRVAGGGNLDDLYLLRTRYAEFAGWLHQDSGHWSAAVWWTERALSSAQETGDGLMTSYVLVKKSQQAEADGDVRLSLTYARAAQSAGSLTATVSAVALQQEAQGLALEGRGDDCLRKLERALHLAARPSEQDWEGPARYCIPEFVEISRAGCLLKLGGTRQAIEIFERGLAVLPAHHYRDRGVYLGQLAAAHAMEGDPAAAVARGREAHEVARATRSHRIVRELRTLSSRLGRWNHLPEVAEFRRSLIETTSER